MDIKKLRFLLEEMTIEEKIGQLVQLTPFFFDEAGGKGETTGPLSEMGISQEELYNIGSVLGTHTKEEVVGIQKSYLKKNRLGIPLVFMADVIHGYETIFPIPLAIASSWNPEVAKEVARLSAIETQEAGVHVTFSPMVDLVRDPRWGRVMESTGEDAYLNSLFAKAFVEGFQGDPDKLNENYHHIAACVKHFAAYGAVEAGREYNTVDISPLELFQYYLPSFQSAIDAGVKLVMTSFNTINGIPSTGNKWLMKDILRKRLKFNGTIISDWGAVGELIPYGVASNGKEAAAKAINAGVDMDMMTNSYQKNLRILLDSGEITQELIDEAVWNILSLKNDLGLFEDPYRGLNSIETRQTFSNSFQEKARNLASQSMVLLKNVENILPLIKEQKVALIGPKANSHDVLGAWSWIGQPERSVTLAEGMETAFEHITVASCKSLTEISDQELGDMLQAAKKAEIVILALGEHSDETGEAASVASIRLSLAQEQLIEEIAKVNPNIVTVLFNGRPLDIVNIEKYSKGILEAWFPGTQAGNAVSDILTGKVNPSGKLPMSFPYTTGQIPIYYNHLATGRPLNLDNQDQKYVSKYLDIPNEPFYPFGYGLSYTRFSIKTVKQSSHQLIRDGVLTFEICIENEGDRQGTETIQLYLHDKVAEIARPVRELKKIKQITLESGKSGNIEMKLTREDLTYVHQDLTTSSDPGSFDIYIGFDSNAPKVGSFILI